ncbi:MAG: hypothetical protein OXF98_06750 [Rhodospirillaceae bacterium]|nr:hypothetical protein [Rhodospirillaceae bacterium]
MRAQLAIAWLASTGVLAAPAAAEVVTGSSGASAAIQFWSGPGLGKRSIVGAEPVCTSEWCPKRFEIHGWEVFLSPTVDPHRNGVLERSYDRIGRAMDHLAAALLSLDHGHVGDEVNYHLRDRIPFYIADYGDPDYHSSEHDPWWPCQVPSPDKPSSKACYRADTQVIGITLGRLAGGPSHYTVMHELAHAYHDLVVEDGFNNRCVARAYELSMAAGKLENVPVFGPAPTPEIVLRPTYASSNHREFFAEITGWFAGTSWRYPSNAHQLWEHSPMMYQLAWEQWIGERVFFFNDTATTEKCLAFIEGLR